MQTSMHTNSLSPQNFAEALQYADWLAKSTMVPEGYRGQPANCLMAIQWASEVGLGTLQVMQDLVFRGDRLAIYGDSMLALVRGSGLCEYVKEECDGNVAVCRVKRKGEDEEVKSTFSVEDACKAGLWGMTDHWQQYPTRMLKMRARAFALRDAFPDVLRGVHSVEEVQDFLDVHGHEMSQEEVAANGAAQVSSTVEVQNQPHQEKTELEPPVEAAPHEEPQSREQNDGSASTDSSFYPQDEFEKNFAKWSEAIRKGRQTADKLEKWVKGRNVVLTKEQKARLVAVESEVQQEIEAA